MANKIHITDKRLQILLHILAWGIIFVVPIYLFSGESDKKYSFLAHAYIQNVFYVIVFYLNYFLLIPGLFFKDRKWLYALSATVLIVSLSLVLFQSDRYYFRPRDEKKLFEREIQKLIKEEGEPRQMPKPLKSWPIYNYILTSFLITGFSMGLRFSDKLIENEKKRKESEKEKLNSELAFLKNQISPHFFFNTLNNIYSLVEIKKEDAQNAILKLSKLMRYLLYDSEHGDIQLSREIDFMKNYIDLMRLRLTDKINLTVSFPENYSDINIPALLFIPFIENAFKHGVSNRELSFIKIQMETERDKIRFNCSNSFYSTSEGTANNNKSIGLGNVKKRLELLYPQKHSLEINKTENTFNIKLEIDIRKNKV
jgi:two-component system, LytTR family, sensor kinase